MSKPREAETVASPAAEFVASHEYLLEEILVLLPAKSLGRFKLVSKQWLSLISDPKLVHDRFRRKSPTGMFLCPLKVSSQFLNKKKVASLPPQVIDTKFVPFNASSDKNKATVPSLEFLKNRSIIKKADYDIEIRQICNGLLLCLVITDRPVRPWRSHSELKSYDYVVCNPTTKQFRLLPRGHWGDYATSEGVLAFDPSISIHYKLICPRNRFIGRYSYTVSFSDYYVLDIYSSEDNSWRDFTLPFMAIVGDCGCYLNGSIYWLEEFIEEEEYYFLRFDVKAEKMTKIRASPPCPEEDNFIWEYFDETGSLHCAVEDMCLPEDFRIVELKIVSSGYCEWVTRNKVCVSALISAYPQVAAVKEEELEEEDEEGKRSWVPGLRCRTLCVVEGRKEEESAVLVLTIPGKVISYDFKHKTVKELCDLPGGVAGYRDFQAFPFTESFFAV